MFRNLQLFPRVNRFRDDGCWCLALVAMPAFGQDHHRGDVFRPACDRSRFHHRLHHSRAHGYMVLMTDASGRRARNFKIQPQIGGLESLR